jgi:hypothetical protein
MTTHTEKGVWKATLCGLVWDGSGTAKDLLDEAAKRPLPILASFHGSSVILMDADGQFLSGQVDPKKANEMAEGLTMHALIRQHPAK